MPTTALMMMQSIVMMSIAERKLKNAPLKRTMILFHGGILLKALGLSLSSSSPSNPQNPPRGIGRIENCVPDFIFLLKIGGPKPIVNLKTEFFSRNEVSEFVHDDHKHQCEYRDNDV